MAGSSELRAAEAEYAKQSLAKSEIKTPWPWYVAAALCFTADRLLKWLALSGAHSGFENRAEFTLFLNKGIAFSIPVSEIIFWPAAIAAIGIITWSFFKSLRNDARGAAILIFILAGALSNLFDRLAYGATVDYLLFFGRSAVNLADGMIIGGLVVLLKQRS